jgi:uncharacterized alkaline shock family protein YloU
MESSSPSQGKTTIAPDVLSTITRLTALSIPGVYRLGIASRDMNRLFKSVSNEGVHIMVDNNVVYVDIYVILKSDVNVRDVSRAIQNKVSRAISEMVGMEVGKVNIHVEDIYFDQVKE